MGMHGELNRWDQERSTEQVALAYSLKFYCGHASDLTVAGQKWSGEFVSKEGMLPPPNWRRNG